MATHSIGTGGSFSTPQLWEDDIPATLVENRVGQLKNEEFTGTGAVIEFESHTHAGFTITFECETGASFKDNANVRTNALRYNASNGAALRATSSLQALRINGVINNVTIRNIQFATTGNAYQNQAFRARLASAGSTITIKDCIFEVSGSAAEDCFANSGSTINLINCVVITRRTAGNGILHDDVGTLTAIGCTIVRPSNITAAGTGINRGYGTVIAKNCAIFGFTTDASGLDTATDYNGTNKSDAASGLPDNTPDHNVYTVTYDTTLFEQPSDSGGAHDFRLKSGSALENTGLFDGTNSPQDISGTTRNNPPEIGAWELAAAATDPFPAGYRREWFQNTVTISGM